MTEKDITYKAEEVARKLDDINLQHLKIARADYLYKHDQNQYGAFRRVPRVSLEDEEAIKDPVAKVLLTAADEEKVKSFLTRPAHVPEHKKKTKKKFHCPAPKVGVY